MKPCEFHFILNSVLRINSSGIVIDSFFYIGASSTVKS